MKIENILKLFMIEKLVIIYIGKNFIKKEINIQINLINFE